MPLPNIPREQLQNQKIQMEQLGVRDNAQVVQMVSNASNEADKEISVLSKWMESIQKNGFWSGTAEWLRSLFAPKDEEQTVSVSIPSTEKPAKKTTSKRNAEKAKPAEKQDPQPTPAPEAPQTEQPQRPTNNKLQERSVLENKPETTFNSPPEKQPAQSLAVRETVNEFTVKALNIPYLGQGIKEDIHNEMETFFEKTCPLVSRDTPANATPSQIAQEYKKHLNNPEYFTGNEKMKQDISAILDRVAKAMPKEESTSVAVPPLSNRTRNTEKPHGAAEEFYNTVLSIRGLEQFGIDHTGYSLIVGFMEKARSSLASKDVASASPEQIAAKLKVLLDNPIYFDQNNVTMKRVVSMILDRTVDKIHPSEKPIGEDILENALNLTFKYVDEAARYQEGQRTRFNARQSDMMKLHLTLALHEAVRGERGELGTQDYDLMNRARGEWTNRIMNIRGQGFENADGSGMRMKLEMTDAINRAWEGLRAPAGGSSGSESLPAGSFATPNTSGGGQFSERTQEHIKDQEDPRFMEKQETIKERAVEDLLPGRKKMLEEEIANGNEAAAQLLDRIKKAEERQPEDVAYQGARAKSVVNWLKNKDGKLSVAADIQGEALQKYEIDLGKYAYQTITIELPEDPELPYGGGGSIDFKPYLHDKFEEWHDAVRAKEAGIRINVDTYPNGRARGVKFEFTRKGLYSVAGKLIAVGDNAEQEKKARIEKANNTPPKGVQSIAENMNAWGKMRVLQIQVNDEETMRIDTRNIKDGEPYVGVNGVTVTRDANGQLAIKYYESGNYKVWGRWGMDRQFFFGEKIV